MSTTVAVTRLWIAWRVSFLQFFPVKLSLSLTFNIVSDMDSTNPIGKSVGGGKKRNRQLSREQVIVVGEFY